MDGEVLTLKNISDSSEGWVPKYLEDNYNWLLTDLRDHRVDQWAWLGSPWPTLTICLLYYYTVRVWAPSFMKDKEPLNIKTLIQVYNLVQTVLNIWLFVRLSRYWLSGQYSWVCQPVDYSSSPPALNMLNIMWWLYISKFLDLLDSIFFALRKKFTHLSTLHVVHHGIMPLTVWSGLKYVGGGQTSFSPFLNTFIHVVMYFYYFLSSLGPQVQKYLWWKRYITKLQMLQFVMFSVNALLPIFMKQCSFPAFYCLVILGHGMMFLVMFANFYLHAYKKKLK